MVGFTEININTVFSLQSNKSLISEIIVIAQSKREWFILDLFIVPDK